MTRRRVLFLLLLLAALCLFFYAPGVLAKSKKAGVVLSTVDIDEEYKILGIVSYRSSKLDPAIIHSELKKQAARMGADHVVGVTYYNNAGYLYGSGTAVKLIEKDESSQ